jgi:hypothetical protein
MNTLLHSGSVQVSLVHVNFILANRARKDK